MKSATATGMGLLPAGKLRAAWKRNRRRRRFLLAVAARLDQSVDVARQSAGSRIDDNEVERLPAGSGGTSLLENGHPSC